jgi:hypothetical protein
MRREANALGRAPLARAWPVEELDWFGGIPYRYIPCWVCVGIFMPHSPLSSSRFRF